MKKDQKFVLTEGAYSDYVLAGTYKALKDFSVRKAAKRFRKSSADVPKYSGYASVFGSWLESEGFAKEIDVIEVYCGEYEFNPNSIGEV